MKTKILIAAIIAGILVLSCNQILYKGTKKRHPQPQIGR